LSPAATSSIDAEADAVFEVNGDMDELFVRAV
jgi:hypothetical protein